MKIIKLFGNTEFVINDDEAENVKKMWFENPDAPIKLKDGTVVNPKSIVAIMDIPTIPYWRDYPLNPDGKSFMRDGQKIFLEAENMREIEYLPDPKYKTNLLKLSN